MNMLVVGGSRGVGKQVVTLALGQGHCVSVLARRPEKINFQHVNLRLVVGDVLDLKTVEKAMSGQDAVICTLGLATFQAIGPPFARRSYVLTKGTQHIIAAMQNHGVRRFICITAIGTGESKHDCTWFASLGLRLGLRWLYKQKDEQEEIVKQSSLDWTIIRPTALTNAEPKGAIATEHLPAGIFSNVSRADVATTLVQAVNRPSMFGKAFTVSNPPRFGDSLRWFVGYFGRG